MYRFLAPGIIENSYYAWMSWASHIINKRKFWYWGTENLGDKLFFLGWEFNHCTQWPLVGVAWLDHTLWGRWWQISHCESVTYGQMIQDVYLPKLRQLFRDEAMNSKWGRSGFQQDWAPPHTARATRQFIFRQFSGHSISVYEDTESPPNSPDLMHPGFFLWSYLKDLIYANSKPIHIEQLKANIRSDIQNIPQETFPNRWILLLGCKL